MIDNVSNYTRCRVITTFMGSKTNYIHTKNYNRKKNHFDSIHSWDLVETIHNMSIT